MVCDLTPLSQNDCTIRMLLQYHMQSNYLGSQMVPCTCRRVPLKETFLHRILTGKGYDYENTSESCDNDKYHYAEDTQSHSPVNGSCESSRIELQTSFLQCHQRLSSRKNDFMDSSPPPSSSSSSCPPFRINSQRHFDRSEPLSLAGSSASTPSSSPLSPQHFSSSTGCNPPHSEKSDSSSSCQTSSLESE